MDHKSGSGLLSALQALKTPGVLVLKVMRWATCLSPPLQKNPRKFWKQMSDLLEYREWLEGADQTLTPDKAVSSQI